MKVLVLFYHGDLVFTFISYCYTVTCVKEKDKFPTISGNHQKCSKRGGDFKGGAQRCFRVFGGAATWGRFLL